MNRIDENPSRAAGESDRREVHGWLAYDWANSAFQTTVVTVLIGPYLTELAQRDVGRNGVIWSLGPLGAVTATSLFPFCLSLSTFLQIPILPLVGALADYTRARKALMATFCYVGAVAACLLVFVSGTRYVAGGLLLIAANLCFGITLALYNAFLNDVAAPAHRDRVSSHGYAIGYLGGGLLLAANLALITNSGRLGMSTGLAVRLSLLSAGLWWGGFSLFTFARLRTRAPRRAPPPGRSALATGVAELGATLRSLRRLPQTLRYLIAYAAFNDGIQTVISVASVFMTQELFVARGQPPNESFLILLILMVQFVAFFGSLLFERIAAWINTKNAILFSLALWAGVVIYAYASLQTVAQAWVLGGVIAIVLGGSQALSRSLFSAMIPAGREASFFGFYEINDRGTSWIGPLIFGIVVGATGSYRQAILSLVAFFVAGIVLLMWTDTDRAIREARLQSTDETG